MKNCKHVYLLAVALVIAGMATRQVSAAQSSTTTSAAPPGPVQVSVATPATANGGSDAKLDVNTALVAEFTHSLSSRNAKPGETVKARVTQDVIAHGRIVVRRDSKLIGHVAEVLASNKDVSGGRLGIVFDKVALKGGGELEFHGLIEALAAPMVTTIISDPMPPPPMGGGGMGTIPQPMGSGTVTRGSSNSTNTNSGGPGANRPSVSGNGARPLDPGAVQPVDGRGALSVGAHGVFGLPGVRLMRTPGGPPRISLVVTVRDNVKLETGTQMVIQVEGPR
jgi:hypothetical protein